VHVRNKFNVKQIANLTEPGIYSDGGGLYLRVRSTGTRSWLFVRMVDGKRKEIGLGSVQDISLSKAREIREHFFKRSGSASGAEAGRRIGTARTPLGARKLTVSKCPNLY